MKTREDILQSKGINQRTARHDYDYLYKSILEAMEEYHQQRSAEEAVERYEKAREHYLFATSDEIMHDVIIESIEIAAGITETKGKE